MPNLSREGSCCEDGCDKPIFAKRMCRRHYSAQYRSQRITAPCKIEGCGKPHCSRGWCQMHYTRWKKYGDPLVRYQGGHPPLDLSQRKKCAQCGSEFAPIKGRAHAQWQRARFCKRQCASTWSAQQQRPHLKTQRAWATSWERHRRIEDRATIKAWKRVTDSPRGPHCRVTNAPTPRPFIGHICRACGATWMSYAAMPDTDYCKPCNKERWGGNHRQRARRYGATFTVVRPQTIFERDGYRCQICKHKTRGTFPHPQSATLDHIIPLSRGGDHSERNLQCACLACNSRKGARATNEQLRLI